MKVFLVRYDSLFGFSFGAMHMPNVQTGQINSHALLGGQCNANDSECCDGFGEQLCLVCVEKRFCRHPALMYLCMIDILWYHSQGNTVVKSTLTIGTDKNV